MKKVFTSLLLLFIGFSAIFAQNNEIKFSGWKQAETEHFVFVYEEASKQATQEFIKIADEAWNKVAKIYSIPKDKIRVYVTGRTNVVNALTYAVPLEIMMFTNPLNISDFPYRSNWAELFFTHELIHAANFSFEDKSKVPQILFGDIIKAYDFLAVDGWALEGLTTVLETELTDGGRGRSPYFELDYKSLTIDNNFLSYDEIGMEARPPAGQSYVMGYLLCRSIADRYGIQALADIERNRPYFGSWANSVKLVTGQSVQDWFSDVRIALAKKYADERKIPEGITISPRTTNTSYYKPAIVFDDGSLIALRSAKNQDTAVVLLDPSRKPGSNHIVDTKPQKDLNTIFSETVLFTGAFNSEESITADANGNVYAILSNQRSDRQPGIELETSLYHWSYNDGLKRVTKGVSLFQPTVSRNGNTLVAVQQNGMHYRLVKVDVETGDISVLYENEAFNCLQPQLNADGTKLAFLYTNNERARIAVINMENPEEVEIVANDDESAIYDPTSPVWSKDNTITYSCNYRGRLESYEAVKQDDKWVSTPVVADPVGVLWSYKNDVGVFYSSVSSTGNVIKIKPADEWGNVPDFEGPSPAGQVVCFGNLQNDYPDFKPYTVLAEQEITKEELEELNKFKSDTEPVPVKGKVIKHRSEEKIQEAQAADKTITTIENEKKFISLPQPVFYVPAVDYFYDAINDTDYFGPAIGAFFTLPRTQMYTGLGELALSYFPKLNNCNFETCFIIDKGSFQIDILGAHSIADYTARLWDGVKFYDETTFILGITKPVFYRMQNRNLIDVSLMAAIDGRYMRLADSACGLNGNFSINLPLIDGKAGFEFYWNREGVKNNDFALTFSLFAISFTNLKAVPSFGLNKTETHLGVDGEFFAQYTYHGTIFSGGIKGRYAAFPTGLIIQNSCLNYGGKYVSSFYPGRLVPRFQIGFPIKILANTSFNLYGEMLYSFDSDLKFTNDDSNASKCLGAEFSYSQGGRFSFSEGISFSIPKDGDITNIFDNSPTLYFGFKYNWNRINMDF